MMKNLDRRVFLALLAAPGLPLRASDSEDPQGWNKAKWGMTREQLSATFDNKLVDWQEKIGNRTFNLFGINAVSIQQIPSTVGFFFNKDKLLTSIQIRPRDRGLEEKAKGNFLDALTTNYGNADRQVQPQSDPTFVSFQWTWLFTKTQIVLEYVRQSNRNYWQLDSTFLSYRARIKADDV